MHCTDEQNNISAVCVIAFSISFLIWVITICLFSVENSFLLAVMMDDKGILRGCKQFCETGNGEVLSYTVLKTETKTEKALFGLFVFFVFFKFRMLNCWAWRRKKYVQGQIMTAIKFGIICPYYTHTTVTVVSCRVWDNILQVTYLRNWLSMLVTNKNVFLNMINLYQAFKWLTNFKFALGVNL